jgi:mannose-6-phosphate isomerase-like protein (cupin superfamily)
MADEVFYCHDLDRAIALFVQLGLRLETIVPADDPSVALLGGRDARVRLIRSEPGQARDHALESEVGRALALDPRPPLRPSYSVARADSAWRIGRAGMQYRDLIPDRQGGRYIASHIRITEGGPVPDYVHYHAVEFQMIYCYQGWVRVVYEDQGEPFVMRAGDCVLQPPQIRHRVLEASPGLEVIEISAPAIHATHVDHELALPTAPLRPDRAFSGQRFARYQAGHTEVARTRVPDRAGIASFEVIDLGIAAATGGIAAARVLRFRGPGQAEQRYRHGAELMFHVVLRGALTLDHTDRLGAADAFVVPAGQAFTWSSLSPELELLEVALPGPSVLEPVAP